MAEQNSIFNGVSVVADTPGGLNESQRAVKLERRVVGGADLKDDFGNSVGLEFLNQFGKEPASQAPALALGGDGDDLQLCLAGEQAGYRKALYLGPLGRCGLFQDEGDSLGRAMGGERGKVSRSRPMRSRSEALGEIHDLVDVRLAQGPDEHARAGAEGFPGHWGGVAKDLSIGAAQVVAVEQGQVNELAGRDARQGEPQRVSRGGRGVEMISVPGQASGEQGGGCLIANGDARRRGGESGQFVAPASRSLVAGGSLMRRKTSWRWASRAAEGMPALWASTSSRETSHNGNLR